MPLSPQINDFMSCPICFNGFSSQRKPVTLTCSHTCCLPCIKSLQSCPFDQVAIISDLPENEAILGLLSVNSSTPCDSKPGAGIRLSQSCLYSVNPDEIVYYTKSVECIKQLALLLKPHQQQNPPLSRPMQRKIISLLHCQIIEAEGRVRAMRNARSIGERALSELLIKHQDPHALSANLWAAVRARGCQFLGPAMQEEVLRLVLLALEDGSALSRKVLVMFVVQRLSPHFPHQASKTAIGHVIQLLYRASCFKLTKRDGDSSLMQLKEEYCAYEALRREHDTQIVSIALEAGLRISPDQWSSLLYGDTAHKSHMQSIIDKLQSPQSFTQSIQEFVIALQRTGDPAILSPLRDNFDKLAQIDASPNDSTSNPSHQQLCTVLNSAKTVILSLVEFLQQFGGGLYRSPAKGLVMKNGQKPKIGRVKPFIHRPDSPQQLENIGFQMNHFPRVGGPSHRPCASVQPTRIIGTSPPLSITPPLILDQHVTQKPIHLAALPTIIVGPQPPNPTAPIISPQPIGSPQGPSTHQTARTSLTASLPSEEDQFIPFADGPFVSKYGPISRTMNLINTPTIAGPGTPLQHRMGNHHPVNNGTHPTNVILGRTAVPSLTLIQPLQQLVLTATTILTEPPPQQYRHGGQLLSEHSYEYQSNDSSESRINRHNAVSSPHI